ncbi:hypothetical protein BFJ63_vAg18058 [Fusarium oxysporum f. sp. narcissi]|uniref:Protein kinase domain-containing protein n=1 Tax=Fusarium oxysporum f. sp. narcissi TaxID=451672 RepID=A0A4Q2UXC0_FUSOX|nr:hypothetical protein BFJ63_vAg18058 [Fusarium oxysporum f. sp. narcissi]
MDVFNTIITSAQIIYNFLDACAGYSDDAASLAARFRWDLRAVEHLRTYFNERSDASRSLSLPEEDKKLLADIEEYLSVLARRVVASGTRIKSQGWLRNNLNRAMWFHREKELRKLESELFEWTLRFDVRVLALPPRVRTVIPEMDAHHAPKVLRSSLQISEFRKLAEDVQERKVDSMFLDHVPNELCGTAQPGQPLQSHGQPVMVELRSYSPTTAQKEVDELRSSLGVLAVALNYVESGSGVNLLNVESLFKDPDHCQFGLVQKLPFPTSKTWTLETLLLSKGPNSVRLPAMHSLSDRFRFAQRLATSLFFIHSTGFIHKNMSSQSVYVFEREGSSDKDNFPYSLGEPYLLGFGWVRSQDGWSDNFRRPKGEWSKDIYEHPYRLAAEPPLPRYINTYDVYGLGVVLLELGLWRPITRYENKFAALAPEERRKMLVDIAEDLNITMGPKYRSVVQWCLQLDGKQAIRDATFINMVLNKLDELEDVISI